MIFFDIDFVLSRLHVLLRSGIQIDFFHIPFVQVLLNLKRTIREFEKDRFKCRFHLLYHRSGVMHKRIDI